jgi:glycosyltransferase involved in cell wall biosynthesis
MDDHPIISVVTPAYNAESTILRCLDSVAAQTYPRIEHIVVDGGSTDGTLRLIAGRAVTLVSEKDAGIYDAMSKGVRMAAGEFVHILNADDAYATPAVLSQMAAVMDEKGWDICHAMAAQVDAGGGIVRRFGRPVSKAALLRKMRIAHPTVVVRRSVYQRYGAFSVGFRIAGDHEFMLRVLDRVRIGFIPQVMVHMSLGGVSTTSTNVARAYRESMSASLMHGANPLFAAVRCYFEIAKHRIFFARKFRQP